jgi:hypothetical protein
MKQLILQELNSAHFWLIVLGVLGFVFMQAVKAMAPPTEEDEKVRFGYAYWYRFLTGVAVTGSENPMSRFLKP